MKKQVGEEEMEDDVEEKRLDREGLSSKVNPMIKGYRKKYIFAIYTSKQLSMGFIYISVVKMSLENHSTNR